MKYLLLKLAEEAGEVVVAAIKHRIHRTSRTRAALEGEIGDVLAICAMLVDRAALTHANIASHRDARIARETKRIKGRK